MKSFVFILFVISFLVSCSNDIKKNSIITEKSLDLQVQEAYLEGMKALEEGDALFAARKVNEVEILFPQSDFAPKSSLMAAYSYYTQDYYEDCIAELERFLKVYSKNKNIDYAYYLLAMSHYQKIIDEKKDMLSIIKAKEYFNYLLSNFPDTEYSSDAIFKIELIDDILAAKEMYIGRYYVEKKKWIPAINRFKNVIDNYDTTIYVEEALYRLVEVYYLLGLKDESLKYAKLLGYNYQSSKWYETSYIIFNEKYEKNKLEKANIDNKKNNNFLKKFKSLFD